MARARAPYWTIVRAGLASVVLGLGGLSCGAVADAITGLRGSKDGSVDVTPTEIALDEGETARLTAVARDAKGTTIADPTISWSVGDTAIAAVSGTGEVAARRAGTTTIDATTTSGARGSATLTVHSVFRMHLLVSPASMTLGVGETGQVTATFTDAAGNPVNGRKVSWISSDTTVVKISATGLIEAMSGGNASIAATSEGAVGTAFVTVSPVRVASITLTLTSTALRTGQTAQAVVTAKDSAGRVLPDRLAKFVSSNSAAATVSSTGLVTGVGPGNATISATVAGQSASASLSVALGAAAVVTLVPARATIIAGQTLQLRSIVRDGAGFKIPNAVITYTSSSPTVAAVSASGFVTAMSQGSAFIVATSEGKNAYTTISVLAATTGNWARFDSDPGDWIGEGNTYSYTPANGTITAGASGVGFGVHVAAVESWSGDMRLPQALGRLQVGTYTGLKRGGFSDPSIGAIDWISDWRGCNETLGSLTIDTVRYASDSLDAIDFSFEQSCDGGPPLRGRIHWRAGRPPAHPPLPPGPIVPIPTDLWAPPASIRPASGNWAYFQSDSGDWIGKGQSYVYTSPPAKIDVITDNTTLSEGHASIGVSQPNAGWSGDLQAPVGLQELRVGYYPDLARYPFHVPARGGLDWRANHNACNELSGWFVIDTVSYGDAGELTALDARFEQHCERGTPALHGAIHWRAADVPNGLAPPARSPGRTRAGAMVRH
jgi:uncharacterized protein YjdB